MARAFNSTGGSSLITSATAFSVSGSMNQCLLGWRVGLGGRCGGLFGELNHQGVHGGSGPGGAAGGALIGDAWDVKAFAQRVFRRFSSHKSDGESNDEARAPLARANEAQCFFERSGGVANQHHGLIPELHPASSNPGGGARDAVHFGDETCFLVMHKTDCTQSERLNQCSSEA